MTDIKQICAQLIELWDADCDINVEINELRAALAEPEPEGPTDAELLCIAAKVIGGYGTDGIRPGEYEPDTECAVESYGSELCDFARAVLARWGRHPGSLDSLTTPRNKNDQ